MKKPNPLDTSHLHTNGSLGQDELPNEHMGDYLVRKKLINSEILYYALGLQQKSSKLLGEILVDEGYVSEKIMGEYSLNRLFNPHRSESLAQLLLKTGKINKKKLKELEMRQQLSGRSLGSILIDE